MILKTFIETLNSIDKLSFSLENGIEVPQHFHVTEVGTTSKSYIDCGGKYRTELLVNFQLWFSDDVEHKLTPTKLLSVFNHAAEKIELPNSEIEVEYQGDTIGKYALSFESGVFILKSKFTNCLAEDQCGITIPKEKVVMASIDNNSCLPGSGCC